MINKDVNILNQQSNPSNNFIYRSLNNYSKNSIDENDFENEYKPDNLNNNAFINKNSSKFIPQRMDSINSNLDFQYQFSIDDPNISKQRLQQYLNNDVLNALDHPSVSRLNSRLNSKISNININNNQFNLFSQPNNSDIWAENYNIQNPNMNTNNNFNHNNSNNNNNQISNNNYTQLNLNSKPFIPAKFRKNVQNIQFQNDIKTNPKKNNGNKFDNNNYEVGNNDWFCSRCKNLNFAFSNICNQCRFPRELSNPSEFNNVYIPQQYY